MRRWLAGFALMAASAAWATPGAPAPPAAPAAAAATADNPAASIVACMRANIPTAVQVKEVEITSRDRAGGERMLRGRLYSTNENTRFRAMLKVSAPPDLAGAAYLTRESPTGDEFYVYVPALNKVRRVTGSSIDGPLWGTDLSYSDLRQIQNAFTQANARLEGEGRVEQRPAHVLSFTPAAAEHSRYSLIRAWVDRKTCMALKVDFLEGKVVSKRMTAHARDLQRSGEHWYLGELTVEDLREKTQTRMKVKGVSLVKELPDRYFNPASFYMGN